MSSRIRYVIFLLCLTETWSQFDPYGQRSYGQSDTDRNQPSQYDRDRYGQGNYDRDRQHDRDRYDRPGQYDRDRYNQYERDRYGQYNKTDQYDRDRYDRPGQYDRDRYNTYGQFDRNRTDQYGLDRNRTDPYGQYDRDRSRPYDRGQYDRGQYDRGQYDRGDSNYGRDRQGDRRYPGQYNPRGFGPVGESIGDANCCEDYCYSEDRDQYLKFGTKTAYEFVYGKTSENPVQQCKPVQFWSLNTDGTRLPDQRTIDRLTQLDRLKEDILRNYDDEGSYPSRGRLCQRDFNDLRGWRWNNSISYSMANTLTSQGQDDIKLLARRYRKRVVELLNVPYSDSHYYFQYSRMDRTHDSYEAFVEGLFSNNAYNVHANVQDDDSSYGGYRSCNTWQQNTYYNPDRQQNTYYNPDGQQNSYYNPDRQQNAYYGPDTNFEYHQFKERPEYKEFVRHVFRRLGFRYVLNDSIIEDMYDMCRYEKAWYINRPSPWCAVFTKRQFEILEYAQDLQSYYADGYGNEEKNSRLGCPHLKDMYERFQRRVNGIVEQKVAVLFTSSAALQHLLVTMGIAKDNIPLSSSNYYVQTRRKWRTSDIAPFAANLAAVLYECEPNQRDTYKIMFYLNENPIDFPECNVGLCSWDAVRSKYQDVVDRCNMDYCNSTPYFRPFYFLNYIGILVLVVHF